MQRTLHTSRFIPCFPCLQPGAQCTLSIGGSGISCGLMSTQQEMVGHLASRNNTTKVSLFSHCHPQKGVRTLHYNEASLPIDTCCEAEIILVILFNYLLHVCWNAFIRWVGKLIRMNRDFPIAAGIHPLQHDEVCSLDNLIYEVRECLLVSLFLAQKL